MTYYGQGLGEIARAFQAIADAIKGHQPVTYNVVINVPEGKTPEDIAIKVEEILKRSRR